MSTTHRRVLGLTAGIAVAAALLAPPASAGTTGVQLTTPPLSGRHPVGTVDLHLVDSRQDPWRPADKRELMVTVTYPAHRDGPRATWMTPGVAGVIDGVASSPDLLDVPRGSVDWGSAKRRARTGATAERTRGGWPVVLFSHGLGGSKELNAGLTDDLASRGYVVASLSHTHEAAAVEFPDGRVAVGSVDPEDAAARKTAIDARVADSRFVLDQLTRLDRGDNPDAERDPLPRGLAGSLDLSRVGMAGHSYGGYTAGETMHHDRRFDAGVNIDGAMGWGEVGEVVEHGLDRPFMLVGGDFVDPGTGGKLEHSHVDTRLDPTWGQFWPNQRAWKRDLHFDRSTHYSFTDLQFITPQVRALLKPGREEELVGRVDARRSLAAQHDYLAGFFDLHLKRRDRGLFDRGPARHPDTRFIA
ncbi:alpha/beta hydrolase family protein [Saccharothrix algeriensis]|uniref:Dienelactone hydrolase n=1 Tax=Saccharothrix algeriensis TaxID=173560 RepID=A0A8T8I4T2_9PSEU|nr:prolyl oligopeptidase family serine peptidase [Saccharothrix algeriensis]MBM7812077.1 dienelactone hydrolase [Saccharothrix algeriensis]QTR05749.1 prolyl oligopeptidase family serine peptidase [Saccharothrix algeriensis]